MDVGDRPPVAWRSLAIVAGVFAVVLLAVSGRYRDNPHELDLHGNGRRRRPQLHVGLACQSNRPLASRANAPLPTVCPVSVAPAA